MKKTTIYIFATLIAALMVFSCVQPLEPGIRTENAGKHQLKLTASCQSPRTKAYADTTAAGENRWNENKISHIDWFIFRDTAANSKPWDFGREPINKADGTSEFNVTSVEMDDYMTDYPDGEGYVLTVANYPSTDEENVFNNLTFSEIRKMGFITQELEALQDGRFTPLNDFVMTSYATHFKLEEEGTPVTVNAELSRLAAKITLNVSIVPYIDEVKAYISGIDTTGIEYVQTWYPDVSGIRAYLTFANDSTTLTPVDTSKRVAQEYNDRTFFTYNSRGFIPEIETNSSTGVSTVTGSPFYSYPMQWKTSDAHAPFIKIILKWEGRYLPNTTNPNGNLGRYINHNTGGTRLGDTVVINSYNKEDGWVKTNSQNFYYKISLPSDHNILYSNVWTKINLDVAVLGGVDEEQTVDVIGRYYVVNWSDPGVAGGGVLNAGHYFNVAGNSFDMYGNSLQIPVSASGPIVVTAFEAQTGNPTATYPLGYSSGNGSLTYSTTSSTGTNFMVTPDANAKYVQIDHQVLPFSTSFSATNGNAKDVAKITYKFRISLDGHPDLYKDITVTQYPSIYVERRQSSGNQFVNGLTNTNGTSRPHPTNNHDHPLGQVTGTSTSYGTYLTVVSVSSLAGLANDPNYSAWVIGDPRIKLSNAYDGTTAQGERYYSVEYNATNDANNNRWLRTDLGSASDYFDNYLVGDKAASDFIAPKFMLASGYGVNQGAGNWRTNSERCATYQESGYPAGRWRVPTEAEILFCKNLARNGLITDPFESSFMSYYATSGRVINTSGVLTGTINTGSTSVRCVYDLWYWGDNQYDNNGNVITGTGTPATQWIGFKF